MLLFCFLLCSFH